MVKCVCCVLACARHARPCSRRDEVRRGRWDLGGGNGPNPCRETLSGTGEGWGRGEEG